MQSTAVLSLCSTNAVQYMDYASQVQGSAVSHAVQLAVQRTAVSMQAVYWGAGPSAAQLAVTIVNSGDRTVSVQRVYAR